MAYKPYESSRISAVFILYFLERQNCTQTTIAEMPASTIYGNQEPKLFVYRQSNKEPKSNITKRTPVRSPLKCIIVSRCFILDASHQPLLFLTRYYYLAGTSFSPCHHRAYSINSSRLFEVGHPVWR